MNIIKILIRILEWSVFIFLTIILFFVASLLLPTKEYVSTHIVSTGSMEPTISAGSIVFSTLKSEEINRGDIIVFNSPDNPDISIIHRVKNIEGEEYTTKGDSNKTEDNWIVFPSNITGKVIFSIPYLGYAVEWMKTPIGFTVVLIIPALFIAYTQYRKIKEGIDEEVEKRVEEGKNNS